MRSQRGNPGRQALAIAARRAGLPCRCAPRNDGGGGEYFAQIQQTFLQMGGSDMDCAWLGKNRTSVLPLTQARQENPFVLSLSKDLSRAPPVLRQAQHERQKRPPLNNPANPENPAGRGMTAGPRRRARRFWRRCARPAACAMPAGWRRCRAPRPTGCGGGTRILTRAGKRPARRRCGGWSRWRTSMRWSAGRR